MISFTTTVSHGVSSYATSRTPYYFNDEYVDLRWLPGGKEIQIIAPHIHVNGDDVLIVPLRFIDGYRHGFVCDGGTIPRPFWSVIERYGKFLPAFINHDYRWSMRGDFFGVTFSDTNDLLYSDCLMYGNKVESYAIYRAVQTFGRGIWERGKLHVDDVDYHYRVIEI